MDVKYMFHNRCGLLDRKLLVSAVSGWLSSMDVPTAHAYLTG